LVEDFSKLLNKKIVIVGKAIYRPSGSVLRIHVEHVEESSGKAAMFNRVPSFAHRAAIARFREETSKRVVAAFFGTWPGDETDEELLVALKELRE
jgi:hypothetical protein